MSETRKHVTAIVSVTFEGDYILAEQATQYLSQWLDGALEDRDDVRGVEIAYTPVVEVPIDGAEELSRSVDELRAALRSQDDAGKAATVHRDKATRRIWRWVIDANNGLGTDVDDLIGVLDQNGMPCPPELVEDQS